jgi:hypothetical protein
MIAPRFIEDEFRLSRGARGRRTNISCFAFAWAARAAAARAATP